MKNIFLRKFVIVMLIVIKISLFLFKKNKYKLWKILGYFYREVNFVEIKRKLKKKNLFFIYLK